MSKRKRKITKAEIEKAKAFIETILPKLDAAEQQASELRAELAGDGDGTMERWLIELRDETGIDAAAIYNDMDMQTAWKFTRAAIRKRKAKADPWVIVAVGDCAADRSTLKRHADDPAKPWIEKAERGKYRIKKSRLAEYVQASELEKYRP